MKYIEVEVENFMLEEIEMLHGNRLANKIAGLPSDKKRVAIFSMTCSKKDKELVELIKELQSDKVSIIYQLDKIIERIRKYNPVGDVEKSSFGEVFTPFWLIEEKLNRLDVTVWSNQTFKWLFPSNGIGNYAIIVIKRLMIGLEKWEVNEGKRFKHIMENMIYVSELQQKNMFLWMLSIDPKSKLKLNLFRGSFLSKEFDEHMKNVWKVEKFNICPENPPYQEMDGGAKASAKPIYNLFVEKCIKICDQTLMITPSRWFAGGKGLDSFRKMMMNSGKINFIQHFDDATKIFGKKVEIKGGVSYFLYDNNYNGKTLFNNIQVELCQFDIIVNNILALPIIVRMLKYDNISKICMGRGDNVFGIQTNDKRLTASPDDDSILCHVSIQKGRIKYIRKEYIKNIEKSNTYKVITVEAATKGGEGFGNIYVSLPGEVLNGSYIYFVTNSVEESKSLQSYLKTKFANFLLSLRKISQHIKPDTLKWIPIVPFDREWTDKELYSYFNLTQEEIDLIEKNNN